MKKVNILFRRLDAEKEIATLKKGQIEIEKRWQEDKEKCNHEITITTWRMKTLDEMLISTVQPRTYCLTCQEHLSPRDYILPELAEKIKNSLNINLQEYPKICNEWGTRKYIKKLEELYKDVYMEYSDLSDYEIGRIMKRRMDVIEAFI